MAYVRVRIPFVEKLSGIAIVKLRYKYHIGTMRIKLDNNQSILRIINNTDETINYTPQLLMGIVDIRSLGYYNVRKSIMFFNKRGNNKIPPPPYKVPYIHPRNYHQTGQALVSTEKASSPQSTEEACSSPVIEDSPKSHENDPYPWLDEDDPRRDMMDEEILDKYIDLSNSDLTPDEKGTLMKIGKTRKNGLCESQNSFC